MIWTLLPVAWIYGFAAELAFRRFADESLVRASINRMVAHVMEFRLFIDSPALIFRAQRELLGENLRLLRLVLLPGAVMAFVFVMLFPTLDAMYGHAPLPAGQASVVSAHMADGTLEAPAGIHVETEGVRSASDHEVSWRVRPLGRVNGELRVNDGVLSLTRRVVAGDGIVYGWRAPFTGPGIEIRYPVRAILGKNWMVWFLAVSSLAAVFSPRLRLGLW
jgi:hypothetical protein